MAYFESLNTQLFSLFFRTFLYGKSYQGALKDCLGYSSELMPINKLRYFERDGIKSTNIPGSNVGFFRVNAVHDGKTYNSKNTASELSIKFNWAQKCWFTELNLRFTELNLMLGSDVVCIN